MEIYYKIAEALGASCEAPIKGGLTGYVVIFRKCNRSRAEIFFNGEDIIAWAEGTDLSADRPGLLGVDIYYCTTQEFSVKEAWIEAADRLRSLSGGQGHLAGCDKKSLEDLYPEGKVDFDALAIAQTLLIEPPSMDQFFKRKVDAASRPRDGEEGIFYVYQGHAGVVVTNVPDAEDWLIVKAKLHKRSPIAEKHIFELCDEQYKKKLADSSTRISVSKEKQMDIFAAFLSNYNLAITDKDAAFKLLKEMRK